MKKVLALILAFSLICLSGCSSSDNKENETTTETQSTASETTTAQKVEVTTAKEEKPDDGELIQNGTFDTKDKEPWTIYFESGGNITLTVEDGKLKADIIDVGRVEYSVQVYQDGFKLIQGGKYQLKFDVYSTIPRQIEYRAQINGGDYHPYFLEKKDITTEVQTLVTDFEMTEETDPAPRFCFNLGIQGDVESMEPHVIYFDNISLKLVDGSGAVSDSKGDKGTDINVDQIGYLTSEKKLAIFRGDALGENFEVINADTDKSVFTGKISAAKNSATSGEDDAVGDFSEVKEKGNYYIKVGEIKSYTFKIGDDVFNNAYDDVVKMLYMQRCGCELPANLAGDFAHPSCHDTKATIYGTNKQIDVSGGWHDAGDFGRYVVSGAKTVADLFISYELNPGRYGDSLGIPESGNGVPDILDEAKYELDWMLKMQTESGAVYHKVTCANFPAMVMPQEETDELIVSPTSIAATGDFAAVMAMGARIFEKIDPKFASTCKAAAQKAWGYLEVTKNDGGFINPSDIVTGQYEDAKQSDERFWAAAELYKLTGDKKYNTAAAKEAATASVTEGFGWAAVGYYGSYAYLTTDSNKKANDATYKAIKDTFIRAADKIASNSSADGYLNSLLADEYCWGSNMSVANNAMLLVLANNITGSDKYTQAAREHIHYLYGRNPMSTCYVTGYGTVSPLNTHHRPSTAIGKTMAGMLVGGPNANLEDPYAKNVLADAAPAKCYADNSQSYSTNEITIYWNSPLIVAMDTMVK